MNADGFADAAWQRLVRAFRKLDTRAKRRSFLVFVGGVALIAMDMIAFGIYMRASNTYTFWGGMFEWFFIQVPFGNRWASYAEWHYPWFTLFFWFSVLISVMGFAVAFFHRESLALYDKTVGAVIRWVRMD
jgi:hypothetical protein